MGRGMALEAEAVAFYEFERDLETVKVGFITNDTGTVGASPDRLVGPAGLLEIKVPNPSTHVAYLLNRKIEQAYYPQVQGQLWIAEREWSDLLSYHPTMPPALIRVPRDEEFIALLSGAVLSFSMELESRAAEMREKGWIKAKPIARPADPGSMEELTPDQEADFILRTNPPNGGL
jgi:YqaJ-like viral recombinase domain